MIKYPEFSTPAPALTEHERRREEARRAGQLVNRLKEYGYSPRLVLEDGCVFVIVPEAAIEAVPGHIWAEAVSHGVQVCS